MDQLRFGIVGIGNMGSGHLNDLYHKKVPNAVLTAVCDLKDDRLAWAKSVCGDEVAYYKDYKEMLASGKIDAVIIATPHYLHPVIGIDAFRAGLNVLSEKPVGVYTKKIEELMQVARESGKTFGLMFNQRTNPAYQKMREIVQSGQLGALKRCVWIITSWYRTQAYYNSGGWRATWAGEGGGVLINQCPHQLDLWQWIFGMPNKIQAFCSFGKYHDIEVEDEVTAYAEYPNGATGVFITTTGECPGTNRLEISGSKGKLVFENGKLKYTALSMDDREYCYASQNAFKQIECKTEETVFENDGEQHLGILKNFTNHILNGEPLLAPGYDGIKELSISNAMLLSTWKNAPVSLPNDGSEFWDYLQEKIKTSRAKENIAEKVFDTAGSYMTK
jgi:predicted dehydrogenase